MELFTNNNTNADLQKMLDRATQSAQAQAGGDGSAEIEEATAAVARAQNPISGFMAGRRLRKGLDKKEAFDKIEAQMKQQQEAVERKKAQIKATQEKFDLGVKSNEQYALATAPIVLASGPITPQKKQAAITNFNNTFSGFSTPDSTAVDADAVEGKPGEYVLTMSDGSTQKVNFRSEFQRFYGKNEAFMQSMGIAGDAESIAVLGDDGNLAYRQATRGANGFIDMATGEPIDPQRIVSNDKALKLKETEAALGRELTDEEKAVALGLQSSVQRVEQGGPKAFSGYKNPEANAKGAGALSSRRSVETVRELIFDEQGELRTDDMIFADMGRRGFKVPAAFGESPARGQMIQAAAFATIEGLIRIRSGAAVPEPELQRYIDAFVPTSFDNKDTANFKLALLETSLDDVLDSITGIDPNLKSEERAAKVSAAIGAAEAAAKDNLIRMQAGLPMYLPENPDQAKRQFGAAPSGARFKVGDKVIVKP